MTPIFVALGGNTPGLHGDVRATLLRALEKIDATDGVSVRAVSRFYRTPAVPLGSGPDFVNAAAELATDWPAETVLDRLLAIEEELGRVRDTRWGARKCDLDLIACGDLILPDLATVQEWMALDLGRAQTRTPLRLILPHPRMHERAFVLVPLRDIAPNWRHPVTGSRVTEMLARLDPDDIASISVLD